MINLIKHIEAENEKKIAWQKEDPANRIVFVTTTDPEHWATYGVHTVEQYELYNLYCEVWDLYKSVNGFRPRHLAYWSDCSSEMLQSMLDSLYVEMKHQIEEEERQIKEEKKAKEVEASLINRESFLPNPVLV